MSRRIFRHNAQLRSRIEFTLRNDVGIEYIFLIYLLMFSARDNCRTSNISDKKEIHGILSHTFSCKMC